MIGDNLVDEALASSKGCVLLGSHLGSLDLMSMKNKVLNNPPITMLMHRDDRSRVRRIACIADIADSKLSIIPSGKFGSYLRAYVVLAGGGIVVALADRAEKSAFPTSSCFGRPVTFPIGCKRSRRAPAPPCRRALVSTSAARDIASRSSNAAGPHLLEAVMQRCSRSSAGT